ncbi:MAG: hypothetical protein ACLSVD_03380 [Eggerthellaceae bacterium]
MDGTLLPRARRVPGRHFEAITNFVAAHRLDAATFSAGLKAGIRPWPSTTAVRTPMHIGRRSSAADRDAADWDELLAGFYERDFGAIGAASSPLGRGARHRDAGCEGYPLVLATMPMLRRAVGGVCRGRASRLRFGRITSFEFHVGEAEAGPTTPRTWRRAASPAKTCSWWATTRWRTWPSGDSAPTRSS